MPRFALLITLICFALSACVTTSSKPKKKVDTNRAVQSNVNLGMNYLRLGNRDNAQRAFNTALEIDRNSAEAHQGLALVRQLNGENELAEKEFKLALNSRADFSMANIEFSYGRFLFDNKRYQEARDWFVKSSSDLSYSNRANAIYHIGLVSLKLNDLAKAQASFEHTVNLDKRNSGAALELAELSFNQEDYASTKRYLDQYLALAKHSPRSLWLGIRLERIFKNKDQEQSYALLLKNLFPYSKEHLNYKTKLEPNAP